MKHLFVLMLIPFLLFSCSDKNVEEVKPINSDEYVDVEIPVQLKSSLKSSLKSRGLVNYYEVEIVTTDDCSNEVYGTIQLGVPENEGNTLASFRMSRALMEQTGLTSDFWIELEDNPDFAPMANGIGGCLKNCEGIDDEARKKACRRGCWIELGLQALGVAAAVTTVVIKIIDM